MRPFSLRRQGLLHGNACVPMLVINGEQDQYIPQEDSTLFARYTGNQVWLMHGMTHCAAEVHHTKQQKSSRVNFLNVRKIGAEYRATRGFDPARCG